MTSRERLERALRLEEVDRLPFWVKIFGASYLLDLDHITWGPSPVVAENERVESHTEQHDGRRITTRLTPEGTLRSVEGFDPSSHSWHPLEFPIKSPDDIRAARYLYAHTRYRLNPGAVERARARLREVGERGVVMTGVGISPLMELIQHQIGPVNTYLFMADFPTEMDELIALMHEDRLRYLRALLGACPYDYIVSVENTSTTLLSPAVFERYCWRHLADYGRLIAEAGKSHVLHMCGKLKALLPRIDDLPAVAIEAYTRPPVGDTTLADRARLCPNTAVIGGTDATLWLRPADEICQAIEGALAEAGSMVGVVLTSAGVMPPAASIEKIRQVRLRLKSLQIG